MPCTVRPRDQNQALSEQTQITDDELNQPSEGSGGFIDEQKQAPVLSQLVLEKIPIPVIRVNEEGMIVLVNEKVELSFPSFQRCIGMDIEEVLPPAAKEAIQRLLDDDASAN